MHKSLLLTATLLVGCGEDEPEPTPITGTETCGTIPTSAPASECSSLEDCGGSANAGTVEFCEGCFARAETHVCEAGTCRAMDTSGTIQTNMSVPSAGAGAKSFTVAAVNPVMADGTQLDCAKILSTCNIVNNFAINAANARFAAFPGSGAVASNVYPVQTPADVGTARLLIVRLHTDVQGKGTILAEGCASGIDVRAGEKTVVSIELAAP